MHINSNVYLLCTWCFTAAVLSNSLPKSLCQNLRDYLYRFLLISSYAFIYLLPTLFILWLTQRWPVLQVTVTVMLSMLTIALLHANGRLYNLYGFHFNGFVWNLLTTPGGLASIGADQTNLALVARYLVTLIGGAAACLATSVILNDLHAHWSWVLSGFVILTLGERVMYSLAYAQVYGPIMSLADSMIFFQPMKMNKFLSSVGYKVKPREKAISMKMQSEGLVSYPLTDIRLNKVEKPYNIIFLVAESLREKNIFKPDIMPLSTEFVSRHGVNFTQHISGGNCTRQALFALFYGLYGSYWDSFLRQQKPPVLMEVLDQYNYQYFLYTSSRFTYPELDKTVFRTVPSELLIETNDGEPWTRDIRNTDMLLNAIDSRNKNLPFMGFVFYEATHARYSFPEEKALRQDYLRSLDYIGLKAESLEPMIDGMFSRYVNSANFLDSQLGRVFDYLEKNDRLKDTIVIATGDHGEEFMEHGRWGHNSSFSNEQIHVPMIICHPDVKPGTVDTLTSHMDIPGMLLETLGVTNPLSDYSLGESLFNSETHSHAVVASWSDLGIVSDKGKLVIPFKGTTQHEHLASSRDDAPGILSSLTQSLAPEITRVIRNSRKFLG